MGFSPLSPKVLRAGIVLVDPSTGQVLRVISLQYNPDSLSRSLQIKGVGGENADHSEVMRLKGPPVETIKFDAEIDATDQLEAGDPQATTQGIHGPLALLEGLVYPTSAQLVSNGNEARGGSIEIIAMQSPLTLLVLSPSRVLPVRLTELSITEDGFDVALNPIRAKVSIGVRVLTVDDFDFDDKGANLFLSYLRQKERFAANLSSTALGALGLTGI